MSVIPSAVLARRPGKPRHYRYWRQSIWGPCFSDPRRTCIAGSHGLFEVQYGGDRRSYWVWHDVHSGGKPPFYDRWTVYDTLPRRIDYRQTWDGPVKPGPWLIL